MTYAVVSGHPCAVAASSHSAWLPTHAHPLLSVHNPDVRASNPFAAFANVLQVLIAATQNMPVVPAVSQSTLPHAQADGLAAEPSVVAQVGNSLHLFWDRSQCMPVVSAVSQLTLPHAQANGLGAEPSAVAQVGRHLF